MSLTSSALSSGTFMDGYPAKSMKADASVSRYTLAGQGASPHQSDAAFFSSAKTGNSGVWALINPVVDTLYNRGEGVRYAIEQTFGYTLPRTWQQLFRTEDLTGQRNKRAAEEIFWRDTGADILDTFLPGLLATAVIGKGLDAGFKTMLRFNIDWKSKAFYQHVASQTQGQSQFLSAIEHSLPKPLPNQSFNLSQSLAEISAVERERGFKLFRKDSPYIHHAQELARKLGFSNLDVTLRHQGRTLDTDLPTLFQDLTRLQKHNQGWGNNLAKTLERSAKLQPLQGLGTAVAFGLSLYFPYWLRQRMAAKYGTDENPAIQEIRKFQMRQAGLADATLQEDGQPKEKIDPRQLRAFPYLQDSLKRGNYWPTALVGLFFAGVGAAVLKDFRYAKNGKMVWDMGRGLKDFLSYERNFPFTTLRQMILTYGALCGLRAMNSRDAADFRETYLRDNLLGYPTLNWGNQILRHGLSKVANSRLQKNLLKSHLLTEQQVAQVGKKLLFRDDAGTTLRGITDMTESMLGNLLQLPAHQRGNLLEITQKVRNANNAVTLASAASSIALLAFLEPQFGIRLTNWFETRKDHTGISKQPVGGKSALAAARPLSTLPTSKAVADSAVMKAGRPAQNGALTGSMPASFAAQPAMPFTPLAPSMLISWPASSTGLSPSSAPAMQQATVANLTSSNPFALPHVNA